MTIKTITATWAVGLAVALSACITSPDVAEIADAFVEIDAMQPPPPPQFLIDALGEENAALAARTCVQWTPDGTPVGILARPERQLPDGRMECDPSFEFVDEADRDPALQHLECAGWPYRPPTPPGGATPGTPAPRVACSPDRSLCCTGNVLGDMACEQNWTVCDADQPILGELNGVPFDILVPSDQCPQDVIDAFPTAYNGCHFLCQHICPTPEW